MVGILVQLALSWAIVWLTFRENLEALGLWPTRKRLADFVLFFAVTGSLCALGFLLKMLIAQQRWQWNPSFEWRSVLGAIWFTVKSTLFEELIFRGAVLYLLIKNLGANKAIVISAISFGIYHWFSHNLFGNAPAMISEFVVTGVMGLVLAFGFARSKSMYIPTAIHLGWGIVQMVLFSSGPVGNQVFVEVMPRPIVTVSYFSFLFMQLFPLVSMYAVNYWLIYRSRPDVKS